MGLIDRDDLHQKSPRQRPFSPPPERPGLNGLGMWLVLALVLFVLYKVFSWNQNPPAAAPTLATTTASPTAARPLSAPAFPAQPASPNPSGAGTAQVTKCIVNGRISYGDATCPQGAISSQVTTRSNHNLMDGFKPQAISQAETRTVEYSAQVQTPYVNEAAAKKSHCQALDAAVKQWDAEARHPQTAQRQDWISEQRKQARDQQFRLHCR